MDRLDLIIENKFKSSNQQIPGNFGNNINGVTNLDLTDEEELVLSDDYDDAWDDSSLEDVDDLILDTLCEASSLTWDDYKYAMKSKSAQNQKQKTKKAKQHQQKAKNSKGLKKFGHKVAAKWNHFRAGMENSDKHGRNWKGHTGIGRGIANAWTNGETNKEKDEKKTRDLDKQRKLYATEKKKQLKHKIEHARTPEKKNEYKKQLAKIK